MKAPKEKLWIKLPIKLLMEYELSCKDIVLLAVLIDLSDRWGISYTSLYTLSKLCECSERTVRRSEARLVAAGLIEVARTGRESCISITDMSLISENEWSAIRQYRKEA
jgi:DNA-binding transcriptional regulator PaaX